MSTASHALTGTTVSWARRLRLDRPVLGPWLIGLLALALFHGVVARINPAYWFQQYSWDEVYYLQIARSGYTLPDGDYGRYTTLPFSPGWPLLLRAASFLTCLHPLLIRLLLTAALFLAS